MLEILALPGKVISAIWNYPFQSTRLVIPLLNGLFGARPPALFGTLCTDPGPLKTKVGWDNVTGVGTPNGKALADAFDP